MRKKIILEKENTDTILFADVDQAKPIFAEKDGELEGMVVKDGRGWMLRLGGSSGSSGYHRTLQKCLESDMKCGGFEFFV